jgi:cell division protein FtsB
MLRSEIEVKDQVMSAREQRREDVGLRRKAVNLASVLLLIALAVGSLFGDRGILHLMQQRERAQSLQREIESLRSENARLASEIRALKSDPHAVERLAREELGLVRPGETVFLIRDETAGASR